MQTGKIEDMSINWRIKIPKIELDAPIMEGTSLDVLEEYVGHFIETSFYKGNVGLAAHNRGYNVSYFERLKELEIGDEIIYEGEFGQKRYTVELLDVIEDTNWSYLENSEDNKITLITCVENMPNLRRCIQGKEIM